MPRDFDIVLYGATGFTGRQTVDYFKRHAPSDLRWAIAGRNRSKLESLNANVPILAADGSDQKAIDAMVERTRVLASTAGPFALYGSDIVDACVRFGTHYADITGETPWVRGLIDRYHEKAAADGTRIVPFCGFDSVPSDLGAMLLGEILGPEIREVKAFFQLKGGVNGGTLASVFNMYETGADKTMSAPFLLSPSTERAARGIEIDPTEEHYDTDAKTWAAPFVMGAINTRVVRRSSSILGVDFAYQEYTKCSGSFAAMAIATGGGLFAHAMHYPGARRFAKAVVPVPGAGPSEHTMDTGWFRCEFFGKATEGRTAHGFISDDGDPGNRVTVKCLCESALALALDTLPDRADRAGVLTPATGIGDTLVNRLHARGMVFNFA